MGFFSGFLNGTLVGCLTIFGSTIGSSLTYYGILIFFYSGTFISGFLVLTSGFFTVVVGLTGFFTSGISVTFLVVGFGVSFGWVRTVLTFSGSIS